MRSTRSTPSSRRRGITIPIEFSEDDGTHTSIAPSGRQWRITPSITGWRLEFCDAGDAGPTYAGTHASLEAAKTEAGR